MDFEALSPWSPTYALICTWLQEPLRVRPWGAGAVSFRAFVDSSAPKWACQPFVLRADVRSQAGNAMSHTDKDLARCRVVLNASCVLSHAWSEFRGYQERCLFTLTLD